MVRISVKFRASMKADTDGMLYYRIVHRRDLCLVRSGSLLGEQEWDEAKSQVVLPERGDKRFRRVFSVKRKIQRDVECLKRIARSKEEAGEEFSCKDIADMFRLYKSNRLQDDDVCLMSPVENKKTFYGAIQILIGELKASGNLVVSQNYQTFLTCFDAFAGGREIRLKALDEKMVKKFEDYLQLNFPNKHSYFYYMRAFSAIYNKLVEKGLIDDKKIFDGIQTREKMVANFRPKTTLSLFQIKQIKEIDLTDKPHVALARDVFLFSFYTRGMHVNDIAGLKKSYLRAGTLTYTCQKTAQVFLIKWEKQMQEIVDVYHVEGKKYFFPLFNTFSSKDGVDKDAACTVWRNKINRDLKTLVKLLNLPNPISLSTARHSWAAVANSNGIPLNVISKGLGHSSEKETKYYIASLNCGVVDNANSKILSLIE